MESIFEEFKRLYADHQHPVDDIAQMLGMSRDIAREYGRMLRGQSRAPVVSEDVKQRREEVRVMTLKRYAQRKMATELQVSMRTLHRDQAQLRKEGKLPPLSEHSPGKPITPEVRARVEAMLDDGCSFKDIHRTVGVSEHFLKDNYPGRGWTHEQVIEYRNMKKVMDRLDGKVRTPLSWS